MKRIAGGHGVQIGIGPIVAGGEHTNCRRRERLRLDALARIARQVTPQRRQAFTRCGLVTAERDDYQTPARIAADRGHPLGG